MFFNTSYSQPIIRFVKNLLKPLVEESASSARKVYPRDQHCISRSHINNNALKVLYRLQKSGHQAYLVGGCVRDLLLRRAPKDFDVATDADPEQIRTIFRNCRLIGRRFRLAHVYFGAEIIEVATFRGFDSADGNGDRVSKNGRLLRDNVYGSIEEDALRRDFTINALYYSIHDFSVMDFVGGMHDLESATLRLIGDPEQRYREDPVRMLRAVRFAIKLQFHMHESSAEPIPRLAFLLKEIPAARLYDESIKLFLCEYSAQVFELLRRYHLFQALFPETDRCLTEEEDGLCHRFLLRGFESTDQRLAEAKPVTPYFFFAVLLWQPMSLLAKQKIERGENEFLALQEAADEVIARQVRTTAFPRRVGAMIREVWKLQAQFYKRSGARPYRLLAHPRLRAAYDFLVLRAAVGEVDNAVVEWWRRFQEADEHERKRMVRSNWRKTRRGKAKKRNAGSIPQDG